MSSERAWSQLACTCIFKHMGTVKPLVQISAFLLKFSLNGTEQPGRFVLTSLRPTKLAGISNAASTSFCAANFGFCYGLKNRLSEPVRTNPKDIEKMAWHNIIYLKGTRAATKRLDQLRRTS